MFNAYKEITMSDYIKPDKLKHKFIVGIDFGHGETSADICNIQWDDHFMKLENPESIEIFNNHKATKSVLLVEHGTDIEGNLTCNYYVGEQAINKYMNVKQQNGDDPSTGIAFFSYFKKVPSLMSPEDRDVMMHFMQEIYLQIRKQRTELTDDNHVVYIACPSDAEKWTDQEMSEYAKIALDAGIPLVKIDDKSTGIIRESRAAFLKARQNTNSKYAVKEGILLIDFGSSTVDLTYYSSLMDKPEDGGDNCGASKIEMEIFEHLKKDNELAAECCSVGKSAEIALQLGIRQSKENFYGTNPVELEIDLNAMKMTRGKVKGHIEQNYSVEELSTMLTEYKKTIANCFKKYRDYHLQGKPITLVFLTGGASRMEFIKDIVKEVFSYEGDFYRENDPSLTISNGIAIAGRADLRSSALLDVLLSELDVVRSQNNVAEKVIKSGSLVIAEAVLDIVEEKYKDFKNQNFDGSLATLETEIKAALSQVNYASLFNRQFEVVLREIVNKNILPQLNTIVADYFPDEKINEISSNHKFSTNVTVSTNNIEMIISKSVDCISEGVVLGLLKFMGTIAGGVVALTVATLFKIIGEIHDLFSDDQANVKFWDVADQVAKWLMPNWNGKDTVLDSEKRSTVYDKFKESRVQFSNSIVEQLEKDLNSDEKLKDSIVQGFSKEVKKYVEEQIYRVRLMLN